MTPRTSIGEHYGAMLESQLNTAIQKKLDATNSFAKRIAGIFTIDDAKSKGHAPNNEQIGQMKTCIKTLADSKYADATFRGLPTDTAVKTLIGELAAEVAKMNDKWRSEKRFAFDKSALDDLAGEATTLIRSEHESAKKNFA